MRNVDSSPRRPQRRTEGGQPSRRRPAANRAHPPYRGFAAPKRDAILAVSISVVVAKAITAGLCAAIGVRERTRSRWRRRQLRRKETEANRIVPDDLGAGSVGDG